MLPKSNLPSGLRILVYTLKSSPERKAVSFLSNYPEFTQVVGILTYTSLFASNFSLLVATIDRFRAIQWPFHTEKFQKRFCIISVVVIWSISLFMAMLPLSRLDGSGVETQFKKGYIYLPFTMMTTCEWNNGPQKHIHDDVWVLLQTTVFSMSLLIMLTVNFMTLRVLRSYTRKQNVRYANSNVVKARVERRGMIILAAMSLAFLFAWLPSVIVNAYSLKHADKLKDLQWQFDPLVRQRANRLAFLHGFCVYTNSAMNPIIYLILDRRYRHNFKVKVLKMNLPDLTSRRGTIAQPTISTRDSTMRESTVVSSLSNRYYTSVAQSEQ